jgi:hypothetical protein
VPTAVLSRNRWLMWPLACLCDLVGFLLRIKVRLISPDLAVRPRVGLGVASACGLGIIHTYGLGVTCAPLSLGRAGQAEPLQRDRAHDAPLVRRLGGAAGGKTPSTLLEASAPSASLDHLKAQAAFPHPVAPP